MYLYIFAEGAFIKAKLPSSALEIILYLYEAGTQNGIICKRWWGRWVPEEFSCYGFTGRLMTIKIIPTEKEILLYAHTINKHVMHHKGI